MYMYILVHYVHVCTYTYTYMYMYMYIVLAILQIISRPCYNIRTCTCMYVYIQIYMYIHVSIHTPFHVIHVHNYGHYRQSVVHAMTYVCIHIGIRTRTCMYTVYTRHYMYMYIIMGTTDNQSSKL